MKAHHFGIAASAMLGILFGYSLKDSNSKSPNKPAGDSVGDHVDVVTPHDAFLHESDIPPIETLQDSESAYREHINEEYEKFKDGIKNDLSVRLHLYTDRDGDDGLLCDSRRVEVGYKLQIVVDGIPFGKGQPVPVIVLRKNEACQKKIDQARSTVLHIMKKIAGMHPHILVCGQE